MAHPSLKSRFAAAGQGLLVSLHLVFLPTAMAFCAVSAPFGDNSSLEDRRFHILTEVNIVSAVSFSVLGFVVPSLAVRGE